MLGLLHRAKIVDFKLYAPNAKTVVLSGTFNKWSTGSTKMKKNDDGFWRAKLKLTAGRYEYKFIVNGNWQTDPECLLTVNNILGVANSLLLVK